MTIIGSPSKVNGEAGAVFGPGLEAGAGPAGLAGLLVQGDDAVLAARLDDGQVVVDQHRFGVAPSARLAAELLQFRDHICRPVAASKQPSTPLPESR